MSTMQTYRKTALITLLAAALLALLAAGGLAVSGLRATTANSEAVRINLPESDEAPAARQALTAAGVVEDNALFGLMATVLKLDELWHAGSYVVEPRTPVYRLIQRINRGQQSPMRLTIGKFRLPQELDAYLGQKLMHDGFEVPLDSFHLVRPDTYEVYWTVSPAQLMQRMARESDRFWQQRNTAACGLTRREAIILASIVEEETNNTAEKPYIASVYLNRLRRGMALQADPTVKYAVGDFALRRILLAHLQTESPFNTYLHTGLPPAPICLPSASSVDAVLHPAQTDYLYFCASEQMDGTHRFASTLAEHNRNASAFHRALNSHGIR